MNRSYPTFAPNKSQAPQPEGDQEVIDLGALLGVLWRGKWLITLVTLICLLAGGYYAYFVATPLYSASSVLILDTQKEQVVDLESVVSGLSSDSIAVNSEVEVMKSRILIGKVVDQLNLTTDPEFNPALRNPSFKQQAVAWVKSLIGSTSIRQEMTDEERQTLARNLAINNVLKAISIRNLPQSFVFSISAVTENPRKSAAITDSLMTNYIRNQLDVKYEATEQATGWLSDRVAELQGELEAAESKVKTFSAQTELVNQDTLIALERQLKDVRSRIETATGTLEASQSRFENLQGATTPQQKVELSNDPQMTRMLPELDRAGMAQTFDMRFQQVLDRAELEMTRAKSQLEALEKSRDELGTQIEQQNNDLIQLQQLTRESDASRLLYEYFLTRLKETSAQQGIQQADSRKLSEAVTPTTPSSPRKPVILVMSFILGFLLSSALVFVRELRQNTFRTSRDLERRTGYSVMGQVPTLPGRSRRKDVLKYLIERPASAAAESIRNLRTSVLLSDVDSPPQIIATTSSLPGEGKTTMALALTQNFTGLGKRVLLIEGDIRRRVLNQYLDINQKEGLIAVLAGEKALEDVVFHDQNIGADILIGERSTSNAADLFSSESFARLLKTARTQYDTIIIDTPPVLIVPDARVIAQQVDAMLFVVAWDRTSKSQVQEALHMFESANQRITGLVLNQISPKGMKRYGYGGKYGSYAAYGRKYYVN